MALNDQNQNVANSRGQHRQERNEQKVKERGRSEQRIHVRLFPIWLRIVLVVLLAIAFSALGMIVGYSVIGDGDASEVFDKSTWTHIRDLITKE